jgi:hypothetical protein
MMLPAYFRGRAEPGRLLFFLTNFIGGWFLIYNSVPNAFSPNPHEMLGSLLSLPCLLVVIAELVAWNLQIRIVERTLGGLFLGFGMVLGAACMVGIWEAMQAGAFPPGFLGFLATVMLLATYFMACGWYRCRSTAQRSPPASPG